MVRGFKGFSRALFRRRARQQFLVDLQVPLKIQRVACSPTLLPRQRRQIFSAKRRSVRRNMGRGLDFPAECGSSQTMAKARTVNASNASRCNSVRRSR